MSNINPLPNYEKYNSRYVISYRLIILFLGLSVIIYSNVTSLLGGSFLSPDKYFTTQSNLFILIWLSLALLWRNDVEKIDKISGSVHVIVTVYITVTFLVYHFILAKGVSPFDNFDFSNFILHYVNPIIFVLDFLYIERKNYSWKNIGYLIIYPHFYLAFALIMGLYITVGDFIYPFLDLNKGLSSFITWYIILFSIFLILFVIYTAYVKFMDKRFTVKLNKKVIPS